MGYIIIIIVIAVILGVLFFGDSYCIDVGDIMAYLFCTFGASVIVILLTLLMLIGGAKEEVRNIPTDNITIVGDSYIVELDGKTESFKKDDTKVDIGDKNYISYMLHYGEKTFMNRMFLLDNEDKIKSLDDKEFVEDGYFVKIGVNKENIK